MLIHNPLNLFLISQKMFEKGITDPAQYIDRPTDKLVKKTEHVFCEEFSKVETDT